MSTPPRVALQDVVAFLDSELAIATVPDYGGAMNGLQVANAGEVRHVATAVDASLATIDAAIAAGADLLVVHHGLFWSGVQPLVGLAYEKYRRLFANGLAVYGAHLPLDLHPEHGNNARLARAVGLEPQGGFARYKTVSVGVQGECDIATSTIVERVREAVAPYGGVVRTSIPTDGRVTRRWGLCTGGGASSESLLEARQAGIDTLIVGEGPHHTTVEAAEHGMCVIFAGHYATETLGVQALGALLTSRFGVTSTFLNLPTGS